MVRTHGWRGDPPRDDAEARERVIGAAMRCIDRYGSRTRLADVAKELGVTRQTVYFYFAGTEELLVATAQHAVGGFLDRLADHVAPLREDAEILAEGMCYTFDRLQHDPYLGILLATGHAGTLTQAITSPTAMTFGRAILTRFDIDWAARGYTDTDLDELVELMLRLLQSFVIDPGHPPRAPAEFRAYLRRWFDRFLFDARRPSAANGPMP
ncbi:TetR family transcriptional regulator [Actinocorallia herbida]|uniref:TetR family transcriptional regulator n=1 Tax=Actinocorallia herbida TaxID=58109 RepID=A0A3N1CUM3_9ACTN|nr:TetR/AcrR family transcriptional regulator [Actinocorallia herbida]ROO84935.1 TetR family transcriptional regulator [Actinocorallia herbida]